MTMRQRTSLESGPIIWTSILLRHTQLTPSLMAASSDFQRAIQITRDEQLLFHIPKSLMVVLDNSEVCDDTQEIGDGAEASGKQKREKLPPL